MSDYFTYVPLTPNTVARAADVNTRFEGVETGFGMLPPPSYISEDRLTYSVDIGSVNVIVANPAIPILAYNDGLHMVVKAAYANTGAVTINVSTLGVKPVKRADGSDLQAGDIVAGQILDLTYDGLVFRLSMAFADLSPAGVIAKIQAYGSFSLGNNASLTILGTGRLIAPSVTINSQVLTPTAVGASLVNAATQAAARSALALGTMATENTTNYVTNASLTSTLASYALLASPPFTGTPTAPTAAPGNNTTQLATTAFVTAAVAAGAGSIPNGNKGDITTAGGGATWTVNDNAITLAKMADMATGSLIYRRTASTGDPEVNTLATLKSDLGLVGNNTGDQTITLSGDVTGSGQAGLIATIPPDTITYAKMQNSAAGNVVLTRANAAAGDWGETALAASNLLGRGSTGDIAPITLGATLNFSGTVISVASVPNSLTFNSGGSGAASGTTFDGATARTISYNTIGAAPDTVRFQNVTSSATVTPTFSNDMVRITAQAVALNLANPTGTAVEGWGIVIRIKDNGTARAITYGTQYRAVGVALPTTTVAGKTLYIGMIFNNTDTKWDVTSVALEA